MASVLLMGAQEARSQEVAELEPLVVSATSTERQLRDAPATISVITREELEERPVQDLSDALRGTPGITINGIGLGRQGISIRGMPEEHTLILLDGKRINTAASAIAHADYDLNWVPVEAIKRIEVVRGPISSLYGSDALGGVVNVITRKATDVWTGSVSAKGGLQEGTGGETYQTGAYVSGPITPGKLGFSLYAEAHGREMTEDPENNEISELEDSDSKTINGTLTWTPDERQRIDLSLGMGHEERVRILESPYIYTSKDEVERRHYSLAHKGDWQWGSTTVRAYRSELDRENYRSRGTASGPHKLTDDIVDGHVTVPVWGWNQITVGGQWRQEQLEDPTVNSEGDATATHQALFFQDEIAIGDSWSLLLGNRADNNENFGWHHSPRAYLVHNLTNDITFKGGVAYGFKAPTLKQLSPDYEASAAGGRFTIVGNPDLQPETNRMVEFGVSYDGDLWSLRGTVFQNDLEDLIETSCTESCGIRGAERRSYLNIDKARIRGIELGGGVALSDGVRVDANYSFLDTENLSTGQDLEERPDHSVNATLTWLPTEQLTARLRGEYVGQQVVYPSSSSEETLPGYALWSIGVSHALTDSVTLRGGVQNLTDKRLSDKSSSYGYAEAGRLVWLGVNYAF